MKPNYFEIAELARMTMHGNIHLVTGAREITRLSAGTAAERDDDVNVFWVIDSETAHLPVGEARHHWNKDALTIKDEELKHHETRLHKRALQACNRLIERFENSN